MSLGPPELLLILVIVLVVFGAGKLPQVGQALGRSIRDFREASEGHAETPVAPATPVIPPAPPVVPPAAPAVPPDEKRTTL